MDNLLAEILAVAKKITRSDMGNIQLVDRDGVLRITVHDGFADEFLAFFSEVKESEAACGTALKTRQTIVVEDVERSPLFVGTPALKIMLNAGARAVQSTPIFSRSGELIGIFSTHYRQPRQIDTHTVRLLGFLAAQAGRYIERLTVAS
ncbi:MAG: GAF domain-containing protein [Candidatus Eremiobacteraeota bacterium]|nr:GAF domain-containing protein [Candidatus Eremiobacteraeota bacterium]